MELAFSGAGDGPPDDLLSTETVAAAVAGDPAAVRAVLTGIHPQVLRFCRARLGRRETAAGSADDVAQDICMAVIGVLPDYRFAGSSFRAFVFGIARHKIADAFRAMARNRCEAVEELPERVCLEHGPEQLALDSERNDRLEDLLSILGPRQVEILTLRIAAGLSAEETAAAIGSTSGAVRVAQHRALQRLRRELDEREAQRLDRVAAAATAAGPTPAVPTQARRGTRPDVPQVRIPEQAGAREPVALAV